MNLNDEQKQYCIDAGKFGFDAKKLSGLLLLSAQEVKDALNEPSDEICKYYSKGKAEFMIEPFKALEREANKGNVKAAKALMELRKELTVQQMTDDFLGR
jgi:hypothetical protein